MAGMGNSRSRADGSCQRGKGLVVGLLTAISFTEIKDWFVWETYRDRIDEQRKKMIQKIKNEACHLE